jgi:hypothetical protein
MSSQGSVYTVYCSSKFRFTVQYCDTLVRLVSYFTLPMLQVLVRVRDSCGDIYANIFKYGTYCVLKGNGIAKFLLCVLERTRIVICRIKCLNYKEKWRLYLLIFFLLIFTNEFNVKVRKQMLDLYSISATLFADKSCTNTPSVGSRYVCWQQCCQHESKRYTPKQSWHKYYTVKPG